ncbi:hypothetical protein K450DRAFT_238493 [Umbelopsis ramanniana AG]|uniref:Secreted protein n=1 Tax=Umbelopsis ramanniana AG TaxID=1314678 RepID=A0AAD5HDD3_UMBRA|nr:uncharacterized protein K450DRAFT_238493 [Umbelopsis ramanniana AG]KAI8580170.1 hypothetical protein K450DRAFT_238493 [Umbelopsis ramanniana AG]
MPFHSMALLLICNLTNLPTPVDPVYSTLHLSTASVGKTTFFFFSVTANQHPVLMKRLLIHHLDCLLLTPITSLAE